MGSNSIVWNTPMKRKCSHSYVYLISYFFVISLITAQLVGSINDNDDQYVAEKSGALYSPVRMCVQASGVTDQSVDEGATEEGDNGLHLLTTKIYSEVSDGYSKFFGKANVDTWSDVRNSSTGNQKNDSCYSYSKGILAAYNSKTGDLYVISRSYFAFNTSVLGANATIVSAALYLYGMGVNESSVCIVSWEDGPDGVDFDDYGAVGTITLGRSEPWNIDRYNVIPINQYGLMDIDTTAYTYLTCREYDHDFLDVTPNGTRLDEYRNGHYFADEPGTTKDPYLLIEYYMTNASNGDHPVPVETPSIAFLSVLVVWCAMALVKRLTK